MAAKAFCREQGLCAHTFYMWRKRLRQADTPRFALVKTKSVRAAATAEPGLEIVFANGERLRISRGVDAATLRATLEAMRA
jgi:transposase-like protein